MISATKQFYENKNLIHNSLVSKKQLIELVATMLKNNIRGFFESGYYKTDINPKIDSLTNFNEIQKYIASLDYLNTLYFYGASIVELVMFENNLIEKNTEIKQASRNATVIRDLLKTKDYSHKLCSNFYVNKSDLKNVILNVFFDLFNTNIDHNSFNNKILKEILVCFEDNFENKLSPIDVYTKLLFVRGTSQLGNLFEFGIDKLNNQIKKSGGVVSNTYISKQNAESTLIEMENIIGEKEIKEHFEIIKQNKELITLLDFEVDVDSTDEDIIEEIEQSQEIDDVT